MEKKNIFLGKINKNGCYVNNGQYGYFLTCDKKNYKIPEWFPHESMTLEIAERLIEYKNKMSKEWLDKSAKEESKESKEESKDSTASEDSSTDEDPRKEMKFTKNKK
jgi:topoisomerase IA-like protein